MASNSDKLGRLARLGGLTSRVASSYVGQKLAGAFRDEAENKKSLERAHIDRIFQTLAHVIDQTA